MKKLKFFLLLIAVLILFPINSNSQIIRPSGIDSRASSQLVVQWTTSTSSSAIQVTNTNPIEGTWIHIQIFIVSDPNGIDNDGDEVICDERNFVDFFTPNDTHVYEFSESNFPKNIGETAILSGDFANIDLQSQELQGFVLITPVVSESDLTAKSFQHLIANSQECCARHGGMGRDAVDFMTGEILPDNTPLDGINNGFIVLQPEELLVDLTSQVTPDPVLYVVFSFIDQYGPEGLLGYTVTPGNVDITSFVFDHKEDPTSCGNTPVNCYLNVGINSADFPQGDSDFLDGLLCDGIDLDPQPGSFNSESGWVRSFVSGIDSNFENVLGYFEVEGDPDSSESSRWMFTNQDETVTNRVKEPTGITSRASSQLLYFYNNIDDTPDDAEDTVIQITNTNDTEGTWIHVQIFRSFNPDDDNTTPDNVICDERDFVDFLTPNDTHVYDLRDVNFTKNIGEAQNTPGNATTIDLTDTLGFVVITPVVSESDLTAKSFQHMIGSSISSDEPNESFITNAMGRDAVDLATGGVLSINTPLDGVTGAFVLLQPDEMIVDFQDSASHDLIGIAFEDNYGPQGLLGYSILPSEITWTGFIFDYRENPTSCGNRDVSCFLIIGLDDEHDLETEELTPDDNFCSGVVLPEHPYTVGFNENLDDFGWLRLFVSGLDERENHIALIHHTFDDSLEWVAVKGETISPVPPAPPEEDCALEGDEDGDGLADCLDADCEADPACENGDQCADGEDNDGDGNSDCADGGCDGATGPNGETCEAGVELTCNDNQDNDGDGTADCDDPDCAIATNCIAGEGGGGGGCSVATTANPSMLNFLLPMLIVGLVIGIMRRR